MKRRLFPVLIGLGGLVILLYLGTWQVQRLAWKQDLLAGIEARIGETPVPLPADPDPNADRYMPVTVTGQFRDAPVARMLASRRQIGAVYRILAPFRTTAGRDIVIDIGWVPTDIAWPPAPVAARIASDAPITLVGNLDWPNEIDGFTPDPDLEKGLWFARNIDPLAQALGTDPILLVLRDAPQTDLGVTPWPVDTAGISNDHLQYAITWFSLAVIWVAMTALFALRMRRTNES